MLNKTSACENETVNLFCFFLKRDTILYFSIDVLLGLINKTKVCVRIERFQVQFSPGPSVGNLPVFSSIWR